MIRFKKGQSILEYVIIFAAIVAAVIAVRGIITGGVSNLIKKASGTIERAANRLP